MRKVAIILRMAFSATVILLSAKSSWGVESDRISEELQWERLENHSKVRNSLEKDLTDHNSVLHSSLTSAPYQGNWVFFYGKENPDLLIPWSWPQEELYFTEGHILEGRPRL